MLVAPGRAQTATRVPSPRIVPPVPLPSTPVPQLYPEFYCRYEDPSYLKRLKIDVLIAIADQTNAYEIAEEMTQVGFVGGGCVGQAFGV